jgi:hypothetical protein
MVYEILTEKLTKKSVFLTKILTFLVDFALKIWKFAEILQPITSDCPTNKKQGKEKAPKLGLSLT